MKIFTFNQASSSPPFAPTSPFEVSIVFASVELFPVRRLEELRIDDNLLSSLPNTLKLLRNLKSISVANNKISKLPDFMTAMRFNNGVVSWF